MKLFVAVMEWGADNRVAKFQDFDTENEALNHIREHFAKYPLAFVNSKPNDSFSSWLINPSKKTLSIDFPVVVPPTAEERIGVAFTESDKDRIIFGILFDLMNEVEGLKSQPAITEAQFKNILKSKLP